MSKIDELIALYCPDGVEFKSLDQVYKFQYGTGNTIPTIGGEYPVYGSNGVVGTHNLYNSEESPVIGHIGAYAGIVNWGKGKHFVTYNGVICKIISKDVLPKYAYYQLLNQDFLSLAHSASQPFVSYGMLNKVIIPIPPLPIQEEIVKILDKFTTLEAELEAELEARTRQYEYYRNQLFAFEGKEVEWKSLGEVATCYAGATPRTGIKQYWENGTIPWMSSGEVNYGNVHHTEKKITQLGFDNSSTKMVPPNTVVVALAGQGKTRGSVAITRISLCTNQSLCSIVAKEEINSNYLYYFLKTQYKQLRSVSSGDGTRGGLNLKMIKDYEVPIPSIEEQERIVKILDKFDALVNDISIGLPAEIKSRREQYEYYRGKLLTFQPQVHS